MICTHTDTEVAQKNSLFLAGDVPGDGFKVLVEQVLCVWCGGQCWDIHADLGDWACGGVKADSVETYKLIWVTGPVVESRRTVLGHTS